MLKKITLILGALSSYCAIIIFCHKFFLKSIEKLSPLTILMILVVLIPGSLFAVLALYIFYKNPKLKDYEIINPPGLMKHKSTGKYFCQKCLITKHFTSEVIITSTKEWTCLICEQKYKVSFNDFLSCKSFFSKMIDSFKETLPEK
ncbi:MAG: hypothetical protein GY941_25200 [Planctomycetes bacterium]|nr:hypothetical protein [Planctomycetota bacterium]